MVTWRAVWRRQLWRRVGVDQRRARLWVIEMMAIHCVAPANDGYGWEWWIAMGDRDDDGDRDDGNGVAPANDGYGWEWWIGIACKALGKVSRGAANLRAEYGSYERNEPTWNLDRFFFYIAAGEITVVAQRKR
eukprot:g12867.t1